MKRDLKCTISPLVPAFLNGSQLPFSFLFVGVTILFVCLILSFIKLNKKGKNLLFACYFGSLILTGIYFSNWPEVYGNIITACLIFIPIIVTAVNYGMFAKYFKSGK